MGRPDLKSNVTRGWRAVPHLKVSIEHVHRIPDYLGKAGINPYRLFSDLAPYATHSGMPHFHAMVAECDTELAALGALARAPRLSFCPSQGV